LIDIVIYSKQLHQYLFLNKDEKKGLDIDTKDAHDYCGNFVRSREVYEATSTENDRFLSEHVMKWRRTDVGVVGKFMSMDAQTLP